jgi:hypothetical protein
MDAAARPKDGGVQQLAMAKMRRPRRDRRVLIAASVAGFAGLAVVGFAFVVPIYQHIVYGRPAVAASSFVGLWGLFAIFGSAASLMAYFQAGEPIDRGPRGGHRMVSRISLEAYEQPAGEFGAEGERRAA